MDNVEIIRIVSKIATVQNVYTINAKINKKTKNNKINNKLCKNNVDKIEM